MSGSLKDARTDKQLVALRRDNFTVGDFWLVADGARVTLAEQKEGKAPTGEVTLPRAVFNRLIDAYQRPQKPRKRTTR